MEVSPIQKVHIEKSFVTKQNDELKARFDLLADQWTRETRYHSSIKHIIGHPAYREIIKMGEAVVPLILERLRKGELNDWFYALGTLTGEYPVPYEARGNMVLMTQAWLDWGIANGLVDSELVATPNLDQPLASTSTNPADRV